MITKVAAAAASLFALVAAADRATIKCTPFDTSSQSPSSFADPKDGPTCNNPPGNVGVSVTYKANPGWNFVWTESDVITRDSSHAGTQVACPSSCGSDGHSTANAQCYQWYAGGGPFEWQPGQNKQLSFAVLSAVWQVNDNTYTALLCSAVCLGYDQLTC